MKSPVKSAEVRCHASFAAATSAEVGESESASAVTGALTIGSEVEGVEISELHPRIRMLLEIRNVVTALNRITTQVFHHYGPVATLFKRCTCH